MTIFSLHQILCNRRGIDIPRLHPYQRYNMNRFFKNSTAIFLSVLLMILAAVSVYAATVIYSNNYTLLVEDDGTTALGGWESEGVLSVPNSVDSHYISSIADYAFMDDPSLTGVDFSSAYTLKRIGYMAFKGCNNISGNVTIPSRVSSLGTSSFQGCASVSSVDLYSGSKSIPNQMFYGCGSLEEVTINYGFETIGKLAFANCQNLQKVTINWTVSEIHDTAFYNSPNTVIYCYTDSYAHEFAETNGIDYVLIDAPATVTVLLGDTNGDGKVNILDATRIQRLLVALDVDPDGMMALRGDVNGDGLNILDATKIQRYLASYSVDEPIGTEVAREVPAAAD